MAVAQKDLGTIDGGAVRIARAAGVHKTVTFVADAGNAYAAADLISDVREITNVADVAGGSVVLDHVTLYDSADQTASAYILVFSSTSTSLGTINSAPNISDANAIAGSLRCVPVATGDWLDVGGAKVATVRNINLPLHCASDSRSIWVGLVNVAGTPTFAASDLVAHMDFA